MMSIPWDRGFAERVNYHLRYEDTKTKAAVAELSRKQARDTALAIALEEGRSFGMRQMRCEMIQQKSLNKLLQHQELTAPSW